MTTLLDARRLMAYAAGLGRTDKVHPDTTRTYGVVGHPVFPVAPEWALLTEPVRAMVPLPSQITVRLHGVREAAGERTASFEVRNDAGDPAVRDGFRAVRP
ncbi:MAG: hypothetical protein ACRDOO_22570 [Actinomadura sp.]